MATPVPERLGKYQVLDRVAEPGPLTEVYKARLDGIAGFSRLFAIKRIRAEIAADEGAVALVEQRAREAAALSHSNVVQVLDLGREDGLLHLVMEWVDGWSLRRVLARAADEETPLPAAHAAWVGLQLLKALEYAHQREQLGDHDRMVHDAVCPANVLVSRGGEVKLTDFGIGRAADELSRRNPDLVPPRIDRATPEQVRGEEVDARTDLFSVGAVLYECLTLVHPFAEADDPTALLRDGGIPSVAERAPDTPEALATAVDSALALDPADRPENATALKNALIDVLRDQPDVFTQETLAEWVRALFGEVLPMAGLPDADELDLDGDGDGVGDDELDATAPAIVPGDDEGTAVDGAAPPRRPVGGWDDEGVARLDPDAASKIATMRDESAAPPPSTPDVALDADAVAQLTRGTWWGGALAAAAAVLVGVLIGVAGTVVASTGGELMAAEPMLDVRGADEVLIDGVSVDGPKAVSAGTHAVQVRLGDGPPLTIDLEVVSGEYRVLSVDAAAAPEPADTDAADP